jgi:hypothetical protein
VSRKSVCAFVVIAEILLGDDSGVLRLFSGGELDGVNDISDIVKSQWQQNGRQDGRVAG